MKYIKRRTDYLLEKISWIESKEKDWDPDFNKLMMSFHDTISDMIVELKDKFNDKDDPDEVYKMYQEYFESAFDALIEQIRYVQDEDYLHKFWREFKLNVYLWKDTFSKLSEKMENYNSVFKLGYEIFSKIGVYITKKVSDDYYKGLKSEDLDTKRQKAIEFVENFYQDIKSRVNDIDPEEIFDMSNLYDKDSDDLVLNAGDEVRYYKQDGEENTALISYNQEELQDEGNNVRLVSKDDGSQFEIDRSELIEIIPKSKTTNQEVSDKLKKVKMDPDKLDKLNNYLTDLTTENMSMSDQDSYLFWASQEEKQSIRVTDKSTKVWMANNTFKNTYIKQIDSMLRDVYKPIGHWKKYKFWGVMDLPWETERWSILNKINTNYSSLTILINEVNRAILEGGSDVPLFDLINKRFGSKQFNEEFVRFLNFLDKNKKKIFLKIDENTGSRVINKIVNVIKFTSKMGENAEVLVAKRLPKMLNGIVNDIEIIAGAGEEEDMVGGIDIVFKLNGNSKTIQVKRCKAVFKSRDGRYMAMGTSVATHYNVDYIAFVSKKVIALFRYQQDKIELLQNGDMMMDTSILVSNIKSNKF